jgi:IS30 family transposase
MSHEYVSNRPVCHLFCDLRRFPRNGILSNLSGYSQADLDKVALRLNQRPRKTLDFETPASKLQASVASIH